MEDIEAGIPGEQTSVHNGAAMAAILAAGFGTFAMGFIVLLNEMGYFAPPTIYGPAGGVSGRTTLAVLFWLISWALLHRRWKGRHVSPGFAFSLTLGMITVGIVATFPPLWQLL